MGGSHVVVIVVIVTRTIGKSGLLVGISIWCWLYVDDVVMQVAISHVRALVATFEAEAAAFQCTLQRRKSAFHVPAIRNLGREAWPADVHQAVELSPLSLEGLPILGTEAC